MNMLTNKIPFGLLSDEEQGMFIDCECQRYNFELHCFVDCSSRYGQNVYRLKLKEGEWYRRYDNKANQEIIPYKKNDDILDWTGALHVYPATQEEVDRAKPKETFVDVEIDWKSVSACFGPYCMSPWNSTEENISVSPVGQIFRGWALSKYLFDDQSKGKNAKFSDETPIIFNNDGTKIAIKATHARFVKIT